MFCRNCGTAVEDDELFCHNCGYAVRQAANNSNNSPSQPDLVKKKSKAPLIIVLSLLVVILAVVGTVVVVKSNSPERRLQAQLDLGQRYLEELDYEQAIACFEAAIEIDPKNTDAYYGLINAYVGLDDPDGIFDVYALASSNLDGKDLRNIEKTVTEEISTMIDNAVDDEDYDRAIDLARDLAEVDEDASQRYIDDISDSGVTVPDPVTAAPVEPEPDVAPVIDRIADNSDIHYMIEKLVDVLFGKSMYIYTDNFSYSSRDLYDGWQTDSFVWYYATDPQMDSYKNELNQTTLSGDNIKCKLTSQQIASIICSMTGINQQFDVDSNFSYLSYENGYYIFETNIYGQDGFVDAKNYTVVDENDDKVTLNADVVVGDWNGYEYKAGTLIIVLSKNVDSIFAGYSISEITYSRSDKVWKDAYFDAVESGYMTVWSNWDSVSTLNNVSIWDHFGYYMDDLDNDGIPEVISCVDGPSAYTDKFNKYTVYHYNGTNVEVGYVDSTVTDYSTWTRYCYEDILLVLTYGMYGTGMEKPNIYIYPDYSSQSTTTFNGHTVVETDVTLTVNGGELTSSWPEPSREGIDYNWHVYASEDGTIYDADGNEYSYLFWEGNSTWTPDFSEGFCVKGEDTAEFLRQTLSEMGLTPKEYNEFIVYWAPRMQCNEYNLISFQGDVYDRTCPLNVIDADGNTPDNLLRVMMAWKAVDGYMTIKPQSFKPFNRDGFTVVEWGGRECK